MHCNIWVRWKSGRAGGWMERFMLRLLRLVIVLSCCYCHLPRLLPLLLLLLQALAADIRLSCELWRDAFNGFDMSHDDAFKGGDARLADAVEERLQVGGQQRLQAVIGICIARGQGDSTLHSACWDGEGRPPVGAADAWRMQ
jgi:hypothetical protein